MGLTFNKILLQMIMFILALYPCDVSAAWSGPKVTVQGNWGTGESEFGLQKGDIKDSIPDTVVVLSNGKIIVADEVNGKLKIFGTNGTFLKAIQIMAVGFYGLDSDKIVSGKLDDKGKTKIGVYSLSTEKWLWVDGTTDVGYLPDLSVYIAEVNDDIYIWNNIDKGYRYSATGTIAESYTTKPLMFGQEVSSDKLADGNYLTIIKFNDITYKCKTPTRFDVLIRDKVGFLYGVAQVGVNSGLHTRIYKITKCGEVLATVDFPPNKRHAIVIHDPPPATDIVTVDEEYGLPVIAPNGDVYTWKRTPDKYSILKWTWVDDAKLTKESCNEQAPAPRQ